MFTFEIRKNGDLLSRHTAENAAEKARILETIRFSQGRGVLRKNDGIEAVDIVPVAVQETPFQVIAAPEKGYRPPSKGVAIHRDGEGVGLNLGKLLRAALPKKRR